MLRSAWDGDRSAATRILARWPEIGAHDIYTAAATGNIAELKRLACGRSRCCLAEKAVLSNGNRCFISPMRRTLLNGDAHAIEMAHILLDHGADPNATFDDGWGNPFKVLTGVIGQGEGDKPPHPHANELALLLIERGADPYDFPGALQYVYHTR